MNIRMENNYIFIYEEMLVKFKIIFQNYLKYLKLKSVIVIKGR